MNVSCFNFQRIFRQMLIAMAGLVLMVGMILGSGISDHSPAFADAPESPGLEQVEAVPNRRGQLNIARDVAEKSVEDEFGVFNLFIIFFVTLGPLKIIPTFIQLTGQANRSLRRQLAFRSTAVATVVILLVVILGKNLLEVWQIQLPALMIAGGILLSLVALQLVLTQYSPQNSQPSPEAPELHMAIMPLAFPTILPPFGIAIALTLMIVATELGMNVWAVILLLLLVMGLNLVCMLAARPIFKFIRPVTLKILGFTLGVMQFALGIQFILSGLEIQALVIRILLQNQ